MKAADTGSAEHHRDVVSGGARAAVFGASDGLVTNVALILGVAGAHVNANFVRLTGLAGLVAGAFSMAAGELVSMQTQRELFQRELAVERKALAESPEGELKELILIYKRRGLDQELATELANRMMSDPERALETHAREELGIDPKRLGSPYLSAISSLIAFGLGAFLPLIPWLFASGSGAEYGTIAFGAGASVCIGAGIGILTGKSKWKSALRQLGVALVASSVTYGIGRAVGANGL